MNDENILALIMLKADDYNHCISRYNYLKATRDKDIYDSYKAFFDKLFVYCYKQSIDIKIINNKLTIRSIKFPGNTFYEVSLPLSYYELKRVFFMGYTYSIDEFFQKLDKLPDWN